jgi:hypothetical protein
VLQYISEDDGSDKGKDIRSIKVVPPFHMPNFNSPLLTRLLIP